MNNNLIIEAAGLCHDPAFEDLSEGYYEKAWMFAARKVARRFSVLSRIITFDSKIVQGNEDINESNYVDNKKREFIKIKFLSFNGETQVKVNDKSYSRADNNKEFKEDYEYILFYGTDSYLFNYSPRGTDDKISIAYTADITIDDLDEESITPIIPTSYHDDMLKEILIYIGSAGMTKFASNKDKRAKYETIWRLNQGKAIEAKGENIPWPTLKRPGVII